MSVFLILAGLALLLMVAVVRTAAVSTRTALRWRAATTVAGRAARTLVTTAVLITGVQWAIVDTVHDWRVLLVVLGAPAFLAAGAVARFAALSEVFREGGRRL